MSKLFSLLLASLPFLSAQAPPACSAPNLEFAQRTSFQLCFDSSRKLPLWTWYQITPLQLHGSAKRPSHFRHDYDLSGSSAYDTDYRASTFSRGHMVPAEDMAFSDASLQDTLLSNVAPQILSLNLGLWRQLEEAVRRIAAHSDAVYVLTGPIFDSDAPAAIGPHHVAIPTAFYKVILAVEDGHRLMYAAILPNITGLQGRLNDYAVTVKEVERRTGLDFFQDLADSEEHELESAPHSLPPAATRP